MPSPEQYIVTATALNVRTAPSLSAKIIGHLTKDKIITALETSGDGNWVKHNFNGAQGWSSKKYLLLYNSTAPIPNGNFPWMSIADKEYGVVEIPGAAHNPRVLEYLSTVTNIGPTWRSQDETPWCSAFVNWCVEKAGYKGTKSALSASWLKWGKKIETPIKGCIAIFSIPGGGGHVGFYFDAIPTISETYIQILGGNQEHMETQIGGVNLRYYLKSRLLGYRVPA